SDSWRDFIRNKGRKGVKRVALESFIKYLSYDPKSFFEIINNNFKECITPGDNATLDETMWGWLGDHMGSVHIERKPHEDGFKVLTLCFEFKQTKR
ncbi:MAG: hypothetical protein ACRDFB_04435, partial [Rhabdochlamydiaceae bacterium]